METTSFYVNTAMVCYNCCRSALVRLKKTGGQLSVIDDETEKLDIFFVVCASCLTLPHVHDPTAALIPKYVHSRIYSDATSAVSKFVCCTPYVYEQKKFSITSLKIKRLAKIRDVSEIFPVGTLPDANIMILEGGCEKRVSPRFFRHEPLCRVRRTVRYPSVTSTDMKNQDVDDSMPFASIANRPPILDIVPASVCSYLEFPDHELPPYSLMAPS
jgi:hypothetical protein